MMRGKVSTQFAGNCEFAFRKDNPITRTSESDKRKKKDTKEIERKRREKSFSC